MKWRKKKSNQIKILKSFATITKSYYSTLADWCSSWAHRKFKEWTNFGCDIELYLSLLLLPLKGEIDVSVCGVIMRRLVRQEYCSLLSTNKRHNIWLSASNYFLTIPVLKLIVVIIFVLRHIEAVSVMLSLGDETNVRWKNELWYGPGKFK